MNGLKVLFLWINILCHIDVIGQPAKPERACIMNFLRYVSGPQWQIDTVVSKFVVFYAEESKVASRFTRKMYLSMAISGLAEDLKKIELDKLTVTPYNEADTKYQIMHLGPDYRQRSYVVTDPAGKFVRYFLIKDNQIEAFELYQKKVYLLLN